MATRLLLRQGNKGMNNHCVVHIGIELSPVEVWESVELYGVPVCQECIEAF